MANPLINLQFGPGSQIFHEGEEGDCAYVVEKGRVEISVRRGGVKTVISTIQPGDIFGEMAIIDGAPRTATAMAVEFTTLTVVTREQITTRIAESDPVLRWLFRIILDRMRGGMRSRFGELFDDSARLAQAAREAGILQSAALDDIKLEGELRRALEQDEFVLYYQPIVDLRRQRVAGFETLIRWQHPQRGLLSPYFFIGVAERTDLIVPIGRWVVQAACKSHRQLSEAARRGSSDKFPIFLGVNLSGRQFSAADFLNSLDELVATYQVDPANLKLEITETMLVNYEAALEWVQRCKEMGFTVALDDFGTGYSSLSYLNRFAIDTLKVDRSFVISMLEDSRSMAIVESIITLARGLGMNVVAEGVEKPEELQALVDLRCDYGQGYLLARPLPLHEAEALLADPGRIRELFQGIHLPPDWRPYGRR